MRPSQTSPVAWSTLLGWLPTVLLSACLAPESGVQPEAESVPPIHDVVDPVVEATKPTQEIDEVAEKTADVEGDAPVLAMEPEPEPPTPGADATDHATESNDPPTPVLEIPPELQPEIDALLGKVGSEDPSPVEMLPRRKRFRHKVVPREQFVQVAHRYGMKSEELAIRNGLAGVPEQLKRGTRLEVFTARVPPHRERLDYAVQEGDTWYSIALRHGVDKRDLRSINYPWKGKLAPGNTLELWVDPIVHAWIEAGDDPLPDDDALALRRGAVGVGPPDNGWLINGVRIPDGDGYRLRLPKSAYGTSHAVAQLLIGLAIFRATTDDPRELQIGAMSRPRGGALGHHLSHQTGRDVDIRLPRRRDVGRYATLTMRRVDWLATWSLIEAMLQTDVNVIFLDYAVQKRLFKEMKKAGIDAERLAILQYPDGRSASGIVRHSPGHDKHIHVRVGCGPYEVECVE